MTAGGPHHLGRLELDLWIEASTAKHWVTDQPQDRIATMAMATCDYFQKRGWGHA